MTIGDLGAGQTILFWIAIFLAIWGGYLFAVRRK